MSYPFSELTPWTGAFIYPRLALSPVTPKTHKTRMWACTVLQVKDRDRIGIQAAAQHDIAVHLRKAEEMNVPLRVAIAISNDPVASLVASAPLKYHEDEYSMMGAIRGEPIEVIAFRAGRAGCACWSRDHHRRRNHNRGNGLWKGLLPNLRAIIRRA